MTLGALLALGTIGYSPAKAYAATIPEVRTAFAPGVDITGPLVASGSTIVFGTHRSTDTGATWASDASLLPVRASSWSSYANGQMLGLTESVAAGVTTRSAIVYTVATGLAQTYTLPSDVRAMGGSWILPLDASTTAYNFVTKASADLVTPTGAALLSGPYSYLSPTGAVIWSGQNTAGKSLFAVSASPTAAPSAWTAVDGLVGGFWDDSWIATTSELQYAVDTGTSIQLCKSSLADLATSACVTAWSAASADFTSSRVTFMGFGSSTGVEITRYTTVGEEARGYLWSGSSVVPIQVPSGSALWMPGGARQYYGDTPYVLVRDTNGVPAVNKLNTDGSLGTALVLPTSPLRPDFLAVATDRMVGGDGRDGSVVQPYASHTLQIVDRYSVWSRTVSGTTVGAENVLPRRASSYVAVAGRTAVSGREGLSMYDRGALGYTFASAALTSISGPYVEQTRLDSVTFLPHTVLSLADGTQVATFESYGALFGSEYVTYDFDGYALVPDAGVVHAVVHDLTGHAAPRTVDLSIGNQYCMSVQVWYGFIAMSCQEGAKVFSLQTGTVVKTVPNSWLENVDDGFMVVGGYDSVAAKNVYRVEPLAGGVAADLADCLYGVQTDGVGQLICTSDSEIIWRDFSSLSTSAGRVLGWLAPTTFASGTWTPQIDVAKPFSAGTLRISQGSTVIRDLTVPASADGSLRGVSWDGKNTAGVLAASGTYTATLLVSGKDGSGAVKAVDGTSAPTFDVTWTGGPVVMGAPGSFAALTPSRLLDTRFGTGVVVPGPVGASGVIDLQVTGRGGVPASGVGAVILNVTAVTPTGPGFLSVYPSGGAVPNASNLNFTPGQVVPNLVVAKVGAGGKVSIKNSSPGVTHVVADVAGFFADGTVAEPGGLTAVSPSRLLDTRDSSALTPGGSVVIQATGRGGVPATGVSSVVVNLTAVTPAGSGFLTAYPTGGAVPNASNVNFTAGQVVPNLAFVKLAADGSFTVKNSSPGATHVVADVAGYVLDGAVTGSGMFVPLTPTRVLDTRPVYGGSGAVGAGALKTLTMTGAGGVPASGVSGVVLNVTAVASAAGFLTVYPADVAAPNASNVNFTAGQVVPNLVAVKTSTTGQVTIKNSSPGSTNVIADVAGYFTS